MQICNKPRSLIPFKLNSVGFLEGLSGMQFSTVLHPRMNDLLMSHPIEFKVDKPSLAVIYIEVPKDF